jgi:hypothetical protein
MASSPYVFYLDILSKWPTSIALASQWFMYFNLDSVGAITTNLSEAVQNYEGGSTAWDISQNTVNQLIKPEFQTSVTNLIGCVFVRQVVLPTETITAANQGLNYGGYQAPATTNGRNPYQKLSVTFTETNASFIDLILRPWAILVGYNGLVARAAGSRKNVKCNYADVISLAKTGAGSPMTLRKAFRFYNLAPINVQGLTNTYASEGLMYTNVDFVYDSYSVFDLNSSSLMTF